MGDVRRDVVLGIDAVLRSLHAAEREAAGLRQLLCAQREGDEALAHRIDPAADPLAFVAEFEGWVTRTRTALAPLRARLNDALDLEGLRVRTPRSTVTEVVLDGSPFRRLPPELRERLAVRLAERGRLLAHLREPTGAAMPTGSAIAEGGEARWCQPLSALPYQLLERGHEAAQVGNPDAGRISGIGHALLLLITDERRLHQNGLEVGGVPQSPMLPTTRTVLLAIAAAEDTLAPLLQLLRFLDRVPATRGAAEACCEAFGAVFSFSLSLRRCALHSNDANVWGSPGRPGSTLLAAIMDELTSERTFVRTREVGPELVSAGYSLAEAIALCDIAEDHESPEPFARRLRRAHARGHRAV